MLCWLRQKGNLQNLMYVFLILRYLLVDGYWNMVPFRIILEKFLLSMTRSSNQVRTSIMFLEWPLCGFQNQKWMNERKWDDFVFLTWYWGVEWSRFEMLSTIIWNRTVNNKQLLAEIFCDIQNNQGWSKSYQPKPKAEVDNPYRDHKKQF